MPNVVVVGTQWGDEGKGKVVDVLAPDFDVIVRYQGGKNAGHTVYDNGNAYVFHLLPSGVRYEGKKLVLGDGMVIDPEMLNKEVSDLKTKGRLNGLLHVSNRAHLTLPHYYEIEKEMERRLKIGTTGQAIGPTYEFVARRAGIRICDLYSESNLKERLNLNIGISRMLLPPDYPLDVDAVVRYLMENFSGFEEYVADTSFLLHTWMNNGESVLFEGAQGTQLDINYGTYPHVTPSHTTAGGASVGAGIAPYRIDKVRGVVKAYPTRVGAGEFPTELVFPPQFKHEEMLTEDELVALLKKGDGASIGKYIRVKGGEYGATTGRPRRPGWPDLVVLRYAKRINGIHEGVITRLDILDGIDPIKVCIGYECKGNFIDEINEPFPASEALLRECKPVYKELPGWPPSTYGVTEYKNLHGNARRYSEFIADIMPITMISTGPRRHETIFR